MLAILRWDFLRVDIVPLALKILSHHIAWIKHQQLFQYGTISVMTNFTTVNKDLPCPQSAGYIKNITD